MRTFFEGIVDSEVDLQFDHFDADDTGRGGMHMARLIRRRSEMGYLGKPQMERRPSETMMNWRAI
jgi:hypothetical protein